MITDTLTYGRFLPTTTLSDCQMTLKFFFCYHFLSSGRNILKFDMKIIQHYKLIWFKTGEIRNTKVTCYISDQTLLVNHNEASYFGSQNNHICPWNFRHCSICNETLSFESRFRTWNLRKIQLLNKTGSKNKTPP